MNKKKSNLFSINKAIIEFAAAILLAIVLFESVNSLGFFEKFYQAVSPRHNLYDRLLLTTAFLAAAMMIFCFRRWFELRKVHKELAKHKKYLEALDKATGILLLSISEVQYDEFLSALGPASGADRILVFLKKTLQGGKTSISNAAQWYANEAVMSIKAHEADEFFTPNIWPKWEKILSSGQVICAQTADFPAAEQSFWNSINLKALLALPIIIDGKLEGFINFCRCTENKPWTESEIEFLDTAAKDLAITLKRLDYKKELKQERDFAQRLIETAQTIVLVMDNDANIVTFNPYFEKLSGYKLEEVKGKNWFDTFLPAEYRQKIHKLFETAVKDVPTRGNVNPILTKSGQLRYIEWFDKTLQDADGKIIAILATGQDITERRQTEAALRESEERFRRMFQHSAAGMVLVDPSFRFLHVNSAFCQMLGYSESDLLTKTFQDITHPDDRASGDNLARQVLAGEIEMFNLEKHYLRRDGTVVWGLVSSTLIRNVEGNPLHFVTQIQDITERKQAEEKLRKAHSELEQRVAQRTAELQNANAELMKTMEERDHIQRILQETEKLAAVGKMSAQIAHEINNPMAGIKNSFLLVKEAIPANHRYFEYVGRIEKEIDRVSQIVRQMFDLYRPDIASAERFRLYDTIEDIVELLKIARQEKNINIEIECDRNTIVTLSEALLRQVIYNIVQNAIQACGQKATVKISVSVGDGLLNLSVSDQGAGIDEAIKDKIFEPFFTTGMGGPKGGLGLGLAITKDIVNAMDGTIDFISEKNKGTTFNISIPLPDEQPK